MLQLARKRIPVTSGSNLIEMAGPERVHSLLTAVNASPVYVRRTGAIAAIELQNYGEDFRIPGAFNNPFKFSFNAETNDNPRNVWCLKRLSLVEDIAVDGDGKSRGR